MVRLGKGNCRPVLGKGNDRVAISKGNDKMGPHRKTGSHRVDSSRR